jgi:hypothetical protein
MATRHNGPQRTGKRATTPASRTASTGTIEDRLLAFAEQMGRVAGTIQSKTEGWMDHEALSARLATVRDSATNLVAQLADRARTAAAAATPSSTAARTAAKAGTKKTPGSSTARAARKGRSGGGVDAPGKKHRTQGPSDPDARLADSQAAKLRAALPMAKTSRRRGRA